MKALIYFILPLTLASCCLGNRKCIHDNYSARFRILDMTTGNDLVFGDTKIYDPSLISFYSLDGADTIFHYYSSAPNPYQGPEQDSLLFVSFHFTKTKTVFVKLNNLDVDTLTIAYPIMNASPCCPEYTTVNPISLNNNYLEEKTGGITILRK